MPPKTTKGKGAAPKQKGLDKETLWYIEAWRTL